MNSNLLALEKLRVTPLVESLKGVPQDPIWHAEGDAWIHTNMVMEALEKIPEFKALDLGYQNILRLAAWCHDIGKATTTKLVDGRLRAFGHSLRSAEEIQNVWWQKGYLMDQPKRDLVRSLVRYHGRPLHGEDDLENHVAATSAVTNCQLVSILAEADVRGRIANDTDEELLAIAMFRECARELECYGQTYEWPNSHAKWSFFQKKRDLNYFAFNDREFIVHMMFGLPRSGKSSYVSQLGLPIVSRDDLRDQAKLDPSDKSDQGRASQLFQKVLKEHLRLKKTFVIDGTNVIRNLRSNTIDLCANYGAAIMMHTIDRDRKTIISHNKEREGEVPEFVIDNMAASMEIPEATETHFLINR